MQQVPVGIDASLNSLLEIYPNPSAGYFLVRLTKSKQEIQAKICDIHGRVIKRIMIDEEVTDIDLTAFPKGVYLFSADLSGIFMPARLLVN